MAVEQCWLTNQTGTIIRFRPSQLPSLPPRDTDLSVELFDGKVIAGRFHLHPANPYVAGPEIRQFIQHRVPARSREEALIDVSPTGRYWRLYESVPIASAVKEFGVSQARATAGRFGGNDLKRILEKIDAMSGAKGRLAAYQRLLRPAGLRRMILSLFGSDCQVDGCTAVQDTVNYWGDTIAGRAIVEVHHIEPVARREDHHPKNLCVLCGNHHRLIHGFGPWTITHAGDEIVLTVGAKQLRIVRDLSLLN